MAFSNQRYSFDHQWINEEILMITATSTYKRRKIDHRIWIKILWRMISYFANDTMIDIKICDKHKTFFSSFINIKFRLLFGSCKQSTFLKIILILQNSILYYYEFYLLGLRVIIYSRMFIPWYFGYKYEESHYWDSTQTFNYY